MLFAEPPLYERCIGAMIGLYLPTDIFTFFTGKTRKLLYFFHEFTQLKDVNHNAFEIIGANGLVKP